MIVKKTLSVAAIAFACFAMLLGNPSSAPAQECALGGGGACSRTSGAALRACRHDVRDDYWIGVGLCRNMSEDRQECLADARDGRSEGLDECEEVCGVRQDVCDALGQDRYDPIIDPADFASPAEIAADPNPYFPLTPGLVRIYEAEDEMIEYTVTPDTKTILGVECIVIRDTVTIDGVIHEDTFDWYTQDKAGNVWYFGELSLNYNEDGELEDIDGSWESGVEGAKPGIIMPASPMVGDFYRQEWYLGEAEDIGEVISITGTESAPGGSCAGNCVVTEDRVPLEPDALEHKYYAPGIGVIVELDPATGDRVELTSVSGP